MFTRKTLFMINSSFNINFLCLKYSSIASWASAFGFSRFYDGGVVEKFWYFIIGKRLFEAGLAINFGIRTFIGIMNCTKWGTTFDTVETFFVPIEALGSDAFGLKNLQKKNNLVNL